MAQVLIAGAGLAGMSAAAALAGAGHRATILEFRPYAGGRACSYDYQGEEIDNCQHILLRCCVNLQDFYRRLGSGGHIHFHGEFNYIEPGGRRSRLRRSMLPAPLHMAGSFLKLRFLALADKLSVARAMLALRRERRRKDLDEITMADWLIQQRQTRGAIQHFWRPVLVSAINEELDRMSAAHGFQVFWLGFLAARDAFEMGIADVPLSRLYQRLPANVEVLFRTPVTEFVIDNGRLCGIRAGGRLFTADHYISALPAVRTAALLPQLKLDAALMDSSPITGIHLWFDRPVTELPHAALLDSPIHWVYNKHDGRHLALVVSASRDLMAMPRGEVIELAVRELKRFFPAAAAARLERAHVVKEMRATFSARPGLEHLRPVAGTPWANLSIAGDWTRSGWPSTMEGAVRSGYLAAEDAAGALGSPTRFLIPDIA